jgi:hypothetical protein
MDKRLLLLLGRYQFEYGLAEATRRQQKFKNETLLSFVP